MNDNEFLTLVATRSGLPSEQAAAATRATLTTLAERIDGGEARDLAGRLPSGLRAHAFGAGEAAERFGLDVFVARVAGRAGLDGDRARDGVAAVFDVLRDALDPTAYEQVVGHLPGEYADVVDQSTPFVRRRA
ncbi:DUF2267 domain-containing protein [Micromonospora sp. KC723]|uniref:DUF2267 domain-containing protein n=1 Tax=Micromonospora sp. KC723 TaxID=2530381 RepID=UPI00104C4A44|nr:DUF2267 domain-containing protein [Micromonospora sp. KC723]TDB73010.1 DUF2267 domain-containing protein [Micromonospora sp. KC723]